MRLRAALFFVFFAVGAAGASAGDLGITSEKLAPALNKAAKSAGLDLRVARGKCSADVKYACQFQAGSGVSFVTGADDKASGIKDITVIYASEDTSDAVNWLATLGVMMAALVPDAEAEERGAALRALIAGLKDGKGSETDLHDVHFETTLPKGLGVWTIISSNTQG